MRRGQRGRGRWRGAGSKPSTQWSSAARPSHHNQGAEEPGERHPAHLRGKAIGLYYRDRAARTTESKEFYISLVIPPMVLDKLQYRIYTTESLAKKHNVDVPSIGEIEDYFDDEEVQIKTEPTIKDDPDVSFESNSVNAPVRVKWDEENASKPNKLDEKMVRCKPSLSEASFETGDFIPIFKTPQPVHHTSPKKSKNSSYCVPEKWDEETNEEIKPEAVISSDKPEAIIKTGDFIPILKTPQPVPPKSPPPNFKAFDFSPSTSKDRVKDQYSKVQVKQEYDCGAGDMILDLRHATNYKYGYNDIITGSFATKLKESLSAGVKILAQSPEITALNDVLYSEYHSMVNRDKYNSMLEFRTKLPAYKKSADILEALNDNQVLVISGETGCGKSTQVPQIILDDAILNRKGGNVKILVTQPRRIAASSLAQRVADERAEKLANGGSVGYAVRLESVEARSRGSITFCTTGILLALLEVNQGLSELSHVILDEVHERDCHVDLAMCMLKQILQKRPDLKVILMSATLDADSLTSYFNCPKLHIEGLAYPVKDVYLEEILKDINYRLDSNVSIKDFKPNNWRKKGGSNSRNVMNMEKCIQYRAEIGPWLESIRATLPKPIYDTLLNPEIEDISIDLIVEVLVSICKGDPGAILVFLPGMADITKVLQALNQSGKFPSSTHAFYPLHSKLPSLEQKQIFERAPSGVRKIIIATNIAETSITIDDIVYVVDCGKMKLKGLNVEQHISTLQTEWISQANLRQRRGRAGRCQPGVCYHLFTSHRASVLAERIKPELQRSDLLEEVLMIKKLRLGKAEEAFKLALDPPDESTVKWAVRHLQRCGALDSYETLTPLGWHLARLPLHPAAGKLLLFGALFGCLDRAASVAAVWGFKDPFVMVIGKEKETDEAKRELSLSEPSDHVAISEAIILWERHSHGRKNFAYDFYLSNNTLQLLSEMKRQLGDNLKQMGFLTSGNIKSKWENRNAGNLSLFKAIVAAALYPNVATVKWVNLNGRNPRKNERITARTPEEGRVEIHPSSVMVSSFSRTQDARGVRYNNSGANWLVYWLKQRSSKLFLHEVTVVNTLPLLFFGEFRLGPAEDSEEDCSISISSVKVRCNKDTALLLLRLRSMLNSVLASNVMSTSGNGADGFNAFELEVLEAVTELITAEDEQVSYINDTSNDGSDSDQSDYTPNHKRWH